MIDYSIEIINSCDEFFVPDTKHFGVKNIQTQRAISIMNRHSIWKFHKLLKK